MLDSKHQAKGAAVSLNAVDKWFGDTAILSLLNLMIHPGEFVSIVGKSGCGKSTLLRLITGLDTATSGTIAVDGQIPTAVAETVRIMFQEPRLLPWASVIDNVMIGLPDADNRADQLPATHDALQAVQLAEKARDWPSSLSGGQKQRVALARALVSRPRLLALDEPLGALDALTRLVMQDLILQVKQTDGFTVLLVTHDVAEAVAMSDRVIVLEGGKIAFEVQIDLPHPRPRASSEMARIEGRILDVIFGKADQFK